jgi:hypothetical protein
MGPGTVLYPVETKRIFPLLGLVARSLGRPARRQALYSPCFISASALCVLLACIAQ